MFSTKIKILNIFPLSLFYKKSIFLTKSIYIEIIFLALSYIHKTNFTKDFNI